MKAGKIPENVLKRSVLKKISNKRGEVLSGAKVGADCAYLYDGIAVSVSPVIESFDNFYRVTNNLAASNAEPVSIFVTMLLPTDTEEADIKSLMDEIEKRAKELNLEISGGHTEVTEAVVKPVINITAVGRAREEGMVKASTAKPGNDIVVTKWIGLEGTAILAKAKSQELLAKFPDRYIYDAQNFDKLLSIVPEAATAVKSGVTAMHDLSTGGIFSGLWEMAESSGVGLTTDLRKIPVKQETIEICNYFDINPYELASAGSLLIACEDGDSLVMALKGEGINASVIGTITDSNDRVMINGDIKRFLEPPKTDEIWKITCK